MSLHGQKVAFEGGRQGWWYTQASLTMQLTA